MYMTKYPNFFTGMGWEDLRKQEAGTISKRLHKSIEMRMDAYFNGELEPKRKPEINDNGYVLGHWTDVQKIPKSPEPTNFPF